MLFKNGLVFCNGAFVKTDVRVADKRFTEIAAGLSAKEGEEVVDCSGKKLLPGLFDIHTHGCLGFDFSKSSVEEDLEMCRFYAKHGVTSVLATTMTNELNQYRTACGEIRRLIASEEAGAVGTEDCATVRGINMEGPFLSKEKRGAHDPQYLYPVTDELFDDLNGASGDAMCLITLAPELEGAMDFIKRHKDRHISLGHSACGYNTAMEAFNSGADHVTHLFNAMLGLAHREPAIPAAAVDSHAYMELICDGLHVHEAVIRFMFRTAADRMVMISDSINPTGLPEGKYSAGGLDVYMRNGEIRLEDGTLAGSSITLFDGLVRTIRFGVPEEEAILAATRNPAESVGMGDRVGTIAEGREADFLIVNEEYGLESVFVKGNHIN